VNDDQETFPQHDYAHLIGSELCVGYSDQNESFASFMPLCGTVLRQITIQDWGTDWLVLLLNEPFDYQTFSPQHGYRGHSVSHILIRARWASHPIGGEQASVFVLLDIGHVLDAKSSYIASDFFHACWGMVPPHEQLNRNA